MDLERVVVFYLLMFDEVIFIYINGEYLVYMLGFVFGFFYLGGMSEEIVILRKELLRNSILKGLVGIVGM